MKVAFLDRDGTINQSFWTHEHEGGPEFWQGPEEPVLLSGALEGMRYLKEQGYELFIITNQYPIGEGQITQEFFDSYMQKLLTILQEGGAGVTDVFYCPHRRDEGCSCCKPRPGMILQALEKYPQIDMTQSFFAGDSDSDEGIAAACGLPFYGVGRACGHPIRSLSDLIGLV